MEEEQQHVCSDGGNPENGYKVGYALPPKKVESFILPSLLQHAQLRGIHFVSVDIVKPLKEQGPFHCILHKLYGNDWIFNLRDFKSKHPHVIIIDCPDDIQRLHNRISMLDIVNHLPPPVPENHTLTLSLGIPKQVVLYTPDAEMEMEMKFPLIAKPLEADGTPNSHHMSIVLNSDGLNKVSPSAPVVLQEFVNHGGVLFKVYVAGNHIRCVKRPSLPDLDLHPSKLESESAQGGILPFSRISNLTATATVTANTGVEDAQIEMPPLYFVHHIAQGLRQALKLHLFNFDMIRDSTLTGRYVIIDINYFPGYAKLPGFESMLTDFFMDLLTPLSQQQHSLGSASASMDGLQLQKEAS